MMLEGMNSGDILRYDPPARISPVVFLDGRQAADPGAENEPDSFPVMVADLEPGVADRLDARGDAVLHERVHASGVLGGQVVVAFEFTQRPDESHGEAAGVEPA